jgi:hypothetical protein
MLIDVRILEVSDEQAFTLGYDRCGGNRDFGFRSVLSEHVELQSVGCGAPAGFHIDDAVLFINRDTVVQLLFGIRADQSFHQFGPDAVSIVDGADRRPAVQFRNGQYDAGADL